MKSALVIMDMQYDFCESGVLPHEKSLLIIPRINRMRDTYDLIIFVKKQLQYNHSIFKQYGGSFPIHCVVDTNGEHIHDDLIIKTDDIVINRGTLQKYDSNSAFYDAEEIYKETRLKQILLAYNIKNLFFCGNGMENSIFSTIMDAIKNKYKCTVISNAITYLDENKMNTCVEYLQTLDVEFIEFV
jgi:nicotinamidase/pyrazinamidase